MRIRYVEKRHGRVLRYASWRRSEAQYRGGMMIGCGIREIDLGNQAASNFFVHVDGSRAGVGRASPMLASAHPRVWLCRRRSAGASRPATPACTPWSTASPRVTKTAALPKVTFGWPGGAHPPPNADPGTHAVMGHWDPTPAPRAAPVSAFAATAMTGTQPPPQVTQGRRGAGRGSPHAKARTAAAIREMTHGVKLVYNGTTAEVARPRRGPCTGRGRGGVASLMRGSSLSHRLSGAGTRWCRRRRHRRRATLWR